jgi:hypothetical protein
MQLNPIAIDGVEDGKLSEPYDSIKVTMAATHVGYTNNNGFHYLDGDATEKSLQSWVKPFHKPVIAHHDRDSDPLGRVLKAYRADYIPPEAADSESDLPTGVVMLDVLLTNKEGIDKVLKGEYLTVSIKCEAETIKCSICDADVQSDEPCDHSRRKLYDGKPCAWNIGNRVYKEVSFVNEPADTSDDHFAGVVGISPADTDEGIEGAPKVIMDSMEPEDKDFAILYDSLGNSTIEVVPSVSEEIKDEDTTDEEDITDWNGDDVSLLTWLEEQVDSALVELDIEDAAPLTEEQKKETNDNGDFFCGPHDESKDRQILPIPQCIHADTALRLMSVYDGPGSKAKVRAALEQRKGQLDCNGQKDSTEDHNDTITMTEQLQHITAERDSLQAKLEPSAIMDNEVVKDKVDSLSSSLEDAQHTIEQLQAKVDGLEHAVDEAQQQSATAILEKENTKLYLLIHRTRAEQVADMEIYSGSNQEITTAEDAIAARSEYVKTLMDQHTAAELSTMYNKLASQSKYGMETRPKIPTDSTLNPGLDLENSPNTTKNKSKKNKRESRKGNAIRLVTGKLEDQESD